MSENDIIQFLIENIEYFNVSNILSSAVRYFIWIIVEFLVWLTDISQELYSKCFEFIDFTTYGPLQKFMEQMEPIVLIVLLVSITLIGYKMIFRPKKDLSYFTNLLIGIFVFTSFTYIMTNINSGVLDTKDNIMNSYSVSGSAANQVISINLTDLLYVDSAIGLKNMNEESIPHANLSEQVIKMLDFNEVVESDSDLISTKEAENIFEKQVTYNPKASSSGEETYIVQEFDDFLSLSSGYYRYHLNTFPVMLSLLSLVIVFLVMGYKVVRLVWEIVVVQLLSIVLSGEIFSGQGMKKLLDYVKNIYIVLFYTLISVRLYLLASEYINAKFSSGIAAFMLFFLAFAVADGPVVIEKILGIDAGLQSGVNKLTAFSHMASGAVRTAQAAYMQHRMNQGMKNIGDAIIHGGNNENIGSMNQNADVGTEKSEMPGSIQNSNNQEEAFAQGMGDESHGKEEIKPESESIQTGMEAEAKEDSLNTESNNMNFGNEMPSDLETDNRGNDKVSGGRNQFMNPGERKEMPANFSSGSDRQKGISLGNISNGFMEKSGTSHVSENRESDFRNTQTTSDPAANDKASDFNSGFKSQDMAVGNTPSDFRSNRSELGNGRMVSDFNSKSPELGSERKVSDLGNKPYDSGKNPVANDKVSDFTSKSSELGSERTVSDLGNKSYDSGRNISELKNGNMPSDSMAGRKESDFHGKDKETLDKESFGKNSVEQDNNKKKNDNLSDYNKPANDTESVKNMPVSSEKILSGKETVLSREKEVNSRMDKEGLNRNQE